jgi:hypothetical protein
MPWPRTLLFGKENHLLIKLGGQLQLQRLCATTEPKYVALASQSRHYLTFPFVARFHFQIPANRGHAEFPYSISAMALTEHLKTLSRTFLPELVLQLRIYWANLYNYRPPRTFNINRAAACVSVGGRRKRKMKTRCWSLELLYASDRVSFDT